MGGRQNNTHLDTDTWALVGDCDTTTYCAGNGTCVLKGCRKDIARLIPSIPVSPSLTWRAVSLWIQSSSFQRPPPSLSDRSIVRWPRCVSGARLTRHSCPDEMDQCLPMVAVGGTCQKDRDGTLADLQGSADRRLNVIVRRMRAPSQREATSRISQHQRQYLPELRVLVCLPVAFRVTYKV